MSKKKTMNQPVRCFVYLSSVGDLQHVNQREQRQMKHLIFRFGIKLCLPKRKRLLIVI